MGGEAEDGSTGQGACHRSLMTEFDSWDPRGGRLSFNIHVHIVIYAYASDPYTKGKISGGKLQSALISCFTETSSFLYPLLHSVC